MTNQGVFVAIEEIFVRSPEGALFSPSGFSEEFWKRYAKAFPDVTVVARVREGVAPTGALKVPEFLSVIELPAYRGLKESFLFLPLLLLRAVSLSRNNSTFILRAPGVLSLAFGIVLAMRGSRYAVELVGDIDDVLKSLLPARMYALLGRGALFLTRYVVSRATAVAYVTESTLQAKYPAHDGAVTASYSSVQIDEVADRGRSQPGARFRIIGVGTMTQRYKGFDVLISAVARLRLQGRDVEAEIIGDGPLISEYAALASSLGVGNSVTFTGRLPRSEVLERMDLADVFVSASRTEGLPRVIIEAMSRGLPVVSTPVGGCAELVLSDQIFPVDDVDSLVSLIDALQRNPSLWARSMRHSRLTAKRFLTARIEKARQEFLVKI